MTDWRAVKSLAKPTDSCDQCGHAVREATPSRIGHWLCREPMVRRVIQRERIAVGVAMEICRGEYHTKAKGAG